MGDLIIQMWCRCCALRAQIDHAEKLAAELPALRAQLALAMERGE